MAGLCLLALGGFDEEYRRLGGYVPVCWLFLSLLQLPGSKIVQMDCGLAFASPSAHVVDMVSVV